ncbi:MAG TPA: DUF5667 domain-containing protein [Actinomycetota bacterium]|nr:DUF5667 domain-containing protein [Actinomycetota bacterium]
MKTPQPKPNKLHDELDALLDGRPVELTDELAPLVEAADVLRAELATFQLDPEVADRHLERALERPGTILELPVRRQPSGWDVRRRVVAVALAAALVLAPATMASAAALPGQAMYPFKRAIEEIRVASVQWSPSREAAERTRIADVRRDELEQLTRLEMFNQIEPAVNALTSAVLAAERAVAEARQEGVDQSEVAALVGQLGSVQGNVSRAFAMVDTTLESTQQPVSSNLRLAIVTAVRESRQVLDPHGTPSTQGPPPVTTPEPKEPETPPPPDPGGSNPGPDPTQGSAPDPSQPSVTTQTTSPPPESTPTTDPAPTTTAEPEATSGSLEGGGGQPTSPGKATDEVGDKGRTTPTTSLPSP